MSHRQPARSPRLTLIRRPPRRIRLDLHPVAAGLAAAALVVMLLWAGATTTYALFRDDVLMQIAARHADAERQSQAEIARLRDGISQARSRLLVERQTFSSRLDDLARRQRDVEQRHAALAKFSGEGESAPAGPADDWDFRLRTGSAQDASGAHPASIEAVEARYTALESDQTAAIAGLRSRLGEKREELTAVYHSLGLAPLPEAPVKAGLGGLYIPFGFTPQREQVSQDLSELEQDAAATERLRTGLEGVPLRSPAPGAPLSSGFGQRSDPFLGGLAFHSGLDLAVPPGTPARATASGTVVAAGWSGNYGLMVEVRHDHGYTTRYAHLSSIAVAEGQEVGTGDVVGRTGSTGRSTGPHLHYETRLNGEPLDPGRLLAAGSRLD